MNNLTNSYGSAKEAVAYAIKSLKTYLKKPRFSVGPGKSKAYLELRRDLPYVIHILPSGGVQILLNRNYKPLGDPSKTGEDWKNYEDFKNLQVEITDEQMMEIGPLGKDFYIFDDGSSPWLSREKAEQYLNRLHKIFLYL